MTRAWMMRSGAFLGSVALVGLGMSAPAHAGSGENHVVEVEDRCDPPTFNAALDPEGQAPTPFCIDNGQNFITFDRFLERLEDGGDNHWRFHPSERTITRGDTVTALNVGGEFHTFTEVTQFGQGCVPELNAAVPDEGPVQILQVNGPCPSDQQKLGEIFDSTGIPADGKLELDREALSVGVHRFECLIHPWMRTTITVEAD